MPKLCGLMLINMYRCHWAAAILSIANQFTFWSTGQKLNMLPGPTLPVYSAAWPMPVYSVTLQGQERCDLVFIMISRHQSERKNAESCFRYVLASVISVKITSCLILLNIT